MSPFIADPTETSSLSPQQVWAWVVEELRALTPKGSFDAYIRDSQAVELVGDVFQVAAATPYARDWLASRLTSMVKRQMAPLVGRPVEVIFITADPDSAADASSPSPEPSVKSDQAAERPQRSAGRTAGMPPAGMPPTGMSPAGQGTAPQSRLHPSQAQPNPTPQPNMPIPQRMPAFSATDAPAITAPSSETPSPDAPSPDADSGNAGNPAPEKAGANPPDRPRQSAPSQMERPAAASLGQSVLIHENKTASSVASTAPAYPDLRAPLPGQPQEARLRADIPAADSPEEEDACTTIRVEEIADTVETAIRQPGKIIAFPRYELRHIPLIGPEAFFLRLAFLQERFLNTPANGRARPFETTVEALLRWANVGRATLHRFKKGDPARGQMPAAGWLGIEQLPAAPRSSEAPQQPPCRYRIQQGIPLTPMDADRLLALLQSAGVRSDPLAAIQSLLDRPQHDLLVFPPPAPSDEIRRRAPLFLSVPGLVQKALEGVKLEGDLRAKVQEAAARLNDHVTQPQQMVFVSWYFLQEWLPLLGHDAAALILYLRAQGYYNPQEHELRDQVTISGGFAELAQVIGLKRDRTIADWLPNLFERQENRSASASDSQKWQREQQRLQKTQQRIAQFVQVQPGSRRKSASGFYTFDLHVEITAEPLSPPDQGVCAWLYRTLAACEQQGVLAHFHAWVTSPALERLAKEEEETQDLASLQRKERPSQNDGAGILYPQRNDGWGILAAQAEAGQTPGRESWVLEDDGWGILQSIFNDGRGILERFEMTARELFKRLLRLNSYWDSILLRITTQPNAPATARAVLVGEDWDLKRLFEQNGGLSNLRQKALRQETSPRPFLSWLFYAYSFKGRGIQDPFGWALKKVIESPGQEAGSVFSDLAARKPGDLARLVRRQIESGQSPVDPSWQYAFQDATPLQLRRLIETLGLAG